MLSLVPESVQTPWGYLHLWINNCGQIQKTKQLSCDETVMLKVLFTPHMYSHPPLLDTHPPPTHTRLQPVAWSYSWNPKTAFPFLLKHFSPSAGQTLWHCGRCCPIRPCGLCCTLTQGAREPGGGCTSQPFGVLLLRVRFASDESTINSRKDWGVCWFARIARRWTFG